MYYKTNRLLFCDDILQCRLCNNCRYSVTGLDENTPYALLVVAANSATDDPQCVTDITLLDSRYLVLVVGTEDAPEGKLLCAVISKIQLVWLIIICMFV